MRGGGSPNPMAQLARLPPPPIDLPTLFLKVCYRKHTINFLGLTHCLDFHLNNKVMSAVSAHYTSEQILPLNIR